MSHQADDLDDDLRSLLSGKSSGKAAKTGKNKSGGGNSGMGGAISSGESISLGSLLSGDQHQHQHQRGAAAANSARGSHPPHATGRSTYSSGGSGGGGPGLGKALGNMFGGASSGGATFPGQRRPTLPKQSRAAPSSRATDRTPSARVPPSDAFPSSPSNSAAKKGRGTPTLLPDDFLRVPGRKYPASSSSGANAASSSTSSDGAALTDEQLARMLQDELFQEELRNNPEFSHLAGRGHMGFGNASGQRTGRSTYSGERGSAGSGGVAWNERTDIFDRLAELGDTAKRRFQEFAANWGDPNRQQAQTNSNSASGGADHRYRSNNERRGLLSNDLDMDEEEEELNFVGGGGGGSGEFVELGDVRGSGSKKKD
mmetsp:Transcript_2212/g.5122  ORF Transcript_2212/g.5122 Transcript_2212/m.5122 type:complete len:371 (-) Transcript_2212:3-1115(-)